MARRALVRGSVAATAALALAAGLGPLAGPAAADAAPPVQTAGVYGIALAGGTLNTVERTASGDGFIIAGRQISPDGAAIGKRTPMGWIVPGAVSAPCDAGGCYPLYATGDGRTAVLVNSGGHDALQAWSSSNSYADVTVPATGGRVVDVTGRFVVYNGGTPAKQYIDDFQQYRYTDVAQTRSIAAASVWGTRLWTASSTTGAVTAIDLKSKKTIETLATGAQCAVKELQAVGRWIYWNCGGSAGKAAGVYDRTTKKSVPVPSGAALVGDGYLVRHDRTAGKLLLTDFHSGTATTRELADLPAGDTADQRRLTWAVDKFGGGIAYVDTQHAVHIVPSGVPAQSLAAIDSDVHDDSLDIKDSANTGDSAWTSTWQLNKPATWKLVVKDALGRTVRTLTGGSGQSSGPSTAIDSVWDGRTDAGTYTYNGRHTWQLTATAADGGGTYRANGSIGVVGGLQGFHDQGSASYGDLLTLDASGRLAVRFGQGNGGFAGSSTGSGWPKGTVAVPFGDMGTDRCAELLVRTPGGELRRYAGKCGGAYNPSSSHTSLGTGWNAYNVLTAPGDLTGDGRTDLIARKASTGDILLFANDGHGKLKPGVKIASKWTGYKKVVGAGDLNGDGYGDLLVQDKSNVLWRYAGTASGKFTARVKVFSGWGASYNAVVGVGDITGDGKADLVARDTSGNLYRQSGNGKGGFGARTKIATGWQTYKNLS